MCLGRNLDLKFAIIKYMNKYYIPALILTLLVIVAIFSFFMKEKEPTGPIIDSVATSTNPFTIAEEGDQLIGTDFRIPGLFDTVTLEKGVKDFKLSGSAGDGMIVYLSSHAVEVNVADVKYLVAPIVAGTGGTGNFLYLVLYKESNGKWEQLGDTLLGDRVFLNSLLVDESYTVPKILATLLVRGENEPMTAEPTIEKTVAFEIKNDSLVETVYYAE